MGTAPFFRSAKSPLCWVTMRRVLTTIFFFLALSCSSCTTTGPQRVAFPYDGGALDRCEAAREIAAPVAAQLGLELDLMMGVMRVESFFRPRVKSRANAIGIMQITPATGRFYKCGNLWDPVENIQCGGRILRRLIRRYKGNEIFALGAYNGGPGYIRKAHKNKTVPRNLGYAEKVLRSKTRFLNQGCAGLVRRMR
jgi:soluble lytic murein transglycosylase-like protein